MTNIIIGAGITILLAMLTYIVSLATQVAKNRNMIIQEVTRSTIEDTHHKDELDAIKASLEKIEGKLDILTQELLGNGK